MDILITGGAGYIGTTLVPLLLGMNHHVTVLDRLMWGIDPIIPFFRNEKFKFIYGDVRDDSLVTSVIKRKDAVVHLAALVGLPACRNAKMETSTVNTDGTYNVYKALQKEQLCVYASTVSIYGKNIGTVTEKSTCLPLSLYASTKYEAENQIMQHHKSVALRFATAFGLSPRMRLDLIVNDMTYQAVKNKSVVVYQPEYIRSSVHVMDIAETILMSLLNIHMEGQIYNVVSDNYSKRAICEEIKEQTGAYFHYADIDGDGDGRDCTVSADKIKGMGWYSRHSLKSGIAEMVTAFPNWSIPNHHRNA